MPRSLRSARRRSIAFLARFCGLLFLYALGVSLAPVNDALIVPFTAGVARASGAILNALGEPVTAAGTELRSRSGFAVEILNGCNGVETALLFGAAVLAFPASWKRRLLGLLLGFAAIELVNLARVVTLFWIGRHRPALFSASHTVIWQSLVVLFGVLLFLLWAARFAAPGPPDGRTPDAAR